MKKNVCKSICFIIVALLLFFPANWLLNTNARSYVRTDEKEATGSQVLFFGTSQGQTAVNPFLLWEETGITSYNFSAGGQYIGVTYYVMKDVLNRVQPKAVVLDYESLVRPEEFLTIGNRLSNLPMIADVKIRMEMYRDIIDESIAYFLPFFRYHNRFKELGIGDAEMVQTVLGSVSSTGILETEEIPGIEETKRSVPVGQREWAYMEQILELVKQIPDCRLVLLDAPGYSFETETEINNWVTDWAEKQGILLCRGNDPAAREVMGLTERDFADHRHLNFQGQKKFTFYLGNWLLENRVWEASSEERAQEVWKADLKKAAALTVDYEIQMEDAWQTVMDLLKTGGQTVVLIAEPGTEGKTGLFLEKAEALGLSREDLFAGGVFVRQKDGPWALTGSQNSAFSETQALGIRDLTVRGNRFEREDGSPGLSAEILLGREMVYQAESGIHLWIYSGYGGGFIKSFEIEG